MRSGCRITAGAASIIPAMLAGRSKEGVSAKAVAAAAPNVPPSIRVFRKAAPPGGRRRTDTSISGRAISARSAAFDRSGLIGSSTRFIAKIATAGYNGSHDASRRMRRVDKITKPVRWNGCEHIRGQRRHIRRVISVKPGPPRTASRPYRRLVRHGCRSEDAHLHRRSARPDGPRPPRRAENPADNRAPHSRGSSPRRRRC
jgi:hypothetical protein